MSLLLEFPRSRSPVVFADSKRTPDSTHRRWEVVSSQHRNLAVADAADGPSAPAGLCGLYGASGTPSKALVLPYRGVGLLCRVPLWLAFNTGLLESIDHRPAKRSA